MIICNRLYPSTASLTEVRSRKQAETGLELYNVLSLDCKSLIPLALPDYERQETCSHIILGNQ